MVGYPSYRTFASDGVVVIEPDCKFKSGDCVRVIFKGSDYNGKIGVVQYYNAAAWYELDELVYAVRFPDSILDVWFPEKKLESVYKTKNEETELKEMTEWDFIEVLE